MSTKRMLLAAGIAALSLTACGGDDGGGESADQRRPAKEPIAGTIEIASVPPGKLRFSPSRLELKAGSYKVVLDNREPVVHNVRIQTGKKCCFKPGAKDVGGTQTTSEVEKLTGTAKLEPGEYVYLCTVGGHWQRGMRGRITVQ